MDSQTRNVALAMMEELNCPRSLMVAILIRSGEWGQIANLATDPLHYLDANSFFRATQATDLIRKVEELDTRIDREANAIAKWEMAESWCYSTNERLSFFLDSLLRETEDRSVENVVLRARGLIRKWLGKLPDWLEPRFGPGATISDKSQVCLIPDKLTSEPTSTPDADFVRCLWRETAWGRAALNRGQDEFKFVRGNVFFLVPKDGKTRRACAKGPSINVSYQLAVGKLLRKRLGRLGIDLDDGQDTHRQLACSASIDGLMASIDLTSASDCMAYNLVKLLLPPDWFDLLNWLREPYTQLPHKGGKWKKLEKFSAMGNGYTFELETLVFLALTCALDPGLTPGRNVFVYGDDILVPTDSARDVISCLRFFGFRTNESKTFLTGPFRESCGGDFWLGQPVRAYQLKSLPTQPHEWIAFANGIRRGLNTAGLCSKSRPWFKCVDNIPSAARLFGPEGLGDLVIVDNEPNSWSVRTKHSIRYFKAWTPAEYRKVLFRGFSYDVQWASALYGTSWGSHENQDQRHLVPRNGVTGYMPKWVPYS
jgi:hypothetical protein